MQSILAVLNMVYEMLFVYSWRDGIEIAAFSAIIYAFVAWLNKDTQKNLVAYFFAYSFTIIACHYAHLTILSTTLILIAPAVLCIFIVLHQHSLQKNFVAATTTTISTHHSEHWVDELMRSSLYAINKSKNLLWVLERKDSLAVSLQAPCLFYADLKKDLIDLLIETHATSDIMLWANETGKLVAMNVHWIEQEMWVSAQTEQLPAWQQQALLLSAKTDALILHACAITRMFTLIGQERIIEHLSAHQAALLLKRSIADRAPLQEGISYATQQPTHIAAEQHHSEN